MSILNINKNEFNNVVLENVKPVLAEYWAPWCVYCKRIAPALDKVAQQFADQIQVVKVNADDNSEIIIQEGIEALPTFVLYKNGQAAAQIIAPDSKVKLESFINENI